MSADLIMEEVNGINVSYQDAGKGNVPVIFIHPFPFNKTAWQPQFNFFQTTHRVISYDLRGLGHSGKDERKVTMDVFADDLVKFMDKLQISQAIVVGLSLGGYIVLNAAGRYPSRFNAIVLCDTQCLADSKENKEKRYESIREMQQKGLDNYAQAFVEKTFTEDTLKNNGQLVKKAQQMIASNSEQGIAGAIGAMAERRESCSKLKELKMPALIICGKEDVLTPRSLSEFLFLNIPGAQLQIIDKAGHLSNLEQPESFNRLLLKFISSLA